jgi:hypothetical protein
VRSVNCRRFLGVMDQFDKRKKGFVALAYFSIFMLSSRVITGLISVV